MKYIEELAIDGGYIDGIVQLDNLEKSIAVCSNTDVSIDYIEKCLNHFENLSEEKWNELKEYMFRYALDNKKYNDTNTNLLKGIYDKSVDVLKGVKFQNILIKYPRGVDSDKGLEPAYSFECSCVWEREHGMEIVIRKDKILYVGQFTDVSMWRSEEKYKECFGNYVYVESIDS